MGCNENTNRSQNFTCKTYANEQNGTFLDTSFSPLVKGVLYVIPKGKGYFSPIIEGNEISVEIKMIDLDHDNIADCVEVKQDVGDMYDAHIIFY